MKKVPCRLPDSELDIMLVLWHNKPPMSRLEIERIVNEKKRSPRRRSSLCSPVWRKRASWQSQRKAKTTSTHHLSQNRTTSRKKATACSNDFMVIL